MRLFYILCLSIILTGCATVPATQKVLIPVATKCYDKPLPIKPKLSVDTMSGEEKADIIINNLTTDIDKLEIYSSELETFICK